MATIIEIGSIQYNDDITIIKKSMMNIESICELGNGFQLGEPMSRFGWTFFQLAIKPSLMDAIEKKFSDMITKYRGKPNEKFSHFLTDYFESKGCKVKLKLIET